MQMTDYLLGFLALVFVFGLLVIVAQVTRCPDLRKFSATLRAWQIACCVTITRIPKP
jgi:hypothetical protein